MQKIVALLAILALLAAGCSGRPSGKEFRQIVYSYTGGIAGFDSTMAVSSDGTVQVAERGKPGRTGRLTSTELKALRQLVNSIVWADVREEYIDPRVADAIVEGLSVEFRSGTNRTRVGTGAQPPAEVAQLLGKLKLILDAQK